MDFSVGAGAKGTKPFRFPALTIEFMLLENNIYFGVKCPSRNPSIRGEKALNNEGLGTKVV